MAPLMQDRGDDLRRRIVAATLIWIHRNYTGPV